MKNCIEAPGVSAGYEGGQRVEAKSCSQSDSSGLMQLNGRGGATAQNEYGAWVWRAGQGSGFINATIKTRMRNAGGWSAQLFATRFDNSAQVFGAAPGDDEFKNYYLYEYQVGVFGAPSVHAQLKCYRGGGCDLDSLGGATNRPDNIDLTVRDWLAPTAYVAGELVSDDPETRWHSGREEVIVAGVDYGSGIKSLVVKVDDKQPNRLSGVICGGDMGAYAVSPQPCPVSAGTTNSIETSVIGNGTHQVRFCAYDYGFPEGNLGCTNSYSIKVDNGDPLQPTALQVAGGSDRWHADNDFDLSWTNPSQGDAAPLVASHHRILDSNGNIVSPMTRMAGATPSLQNIAVPNVPGDYTIEILLEDAAGNLGAPARASLRFDNKRPQVATPMVTSEWLSRTELPHLQRLIKPIQPIPVSGIEGYAHLVDQSPESSPCAAADRCTSSETDIKDGIDGNTFLISDLPEGSSYVHSVGVSRSGMSSLSVGHGELRVDKTDPVTFLFGADEAWTNQSVALTARSFDALSGMTANPEQTPFTAIQVDGGPAAVSVGDTVTAAITGEGVHEAAFYARDLAGNLNNGGATNGIQNRPPQTIQVRIDRSQPGVTFTNAQDPDDPELIRAAIRDPLSGPDPSRVEIGVRRVGGDGSFSGLPTGFSDGAVQARWNSDSFPAGEYEFRATAFDIAGNATTTRRRADGTEMVLPNPLKVPTAIRAGFNSKSGALGRVRRRMVAYGGSAQVRGRLTAGLGSPLVGETVQVAEIFDAGARVPRRSTVLRTKRGGIFSLRLRPGPSRVVKVSYNGTRTLTQASSRPVRMITKSGLLLRTSSSTAAVGGAPIIFSGRIKRQGARLPVDGKSIRIDYRVASTPWTEFRTLPADPRGRFKISYAFSDDESRGVAFHFRAVALKQSDWPYAPGTSTVRTVRGR